MKLHVTSWQPGDLPPEHGILLIRHGRRLAGNSPSSSATLTKLGEQECYQLGKCLRAYCPEAMLCSPLKRCMDSGIHIIEGAGWELAIQSSTMLGDPGPFVMPQENIVLEQLQRHARGEEVAGMKSRDHGTRDLYKWLFEHLQNGYLLCISHDAIIAAVGASLGIPPDPWPKFLEGICIRGK